MEENCDKRLEIKLNDPTPLCFDKWGLPLKRMGVPQPASFESERSRKQEWSQQDLNIFLTGNSLFTYYSVPTVICGSALGLQLFVNIQLSKPVPHHLHLQWYSNFHLHLVQLSQATLTHLLHLLIHYKVLPHLSQSLFLQTVKLKCTTNLRQMLSLSSKFQKNFDLITLEGNNCN